MIFSKQHICRLYCVAPFVRTTHNRDHSGRTLRGTVVPVNCQSTACSLIRKQTFEATSRDCRFSERTWYATGSIFCSGLISITKFASIIASSSASRNLGVIRESQIGQNHSREGGVELEMIVNERSSSDKNVKRMTNRAEHAGWWVISTKRDSDSLSHSGRSCRTQMKGCSSGTASVAGAMM